MEMESVIFQMQFVLEKNKTKKNAMNFPLIYAPSRFFSLLWTLGFWFFPNNESLPNWYVSLRLGEATGIPAPGTVRSSMSWSGDRVGKVKILLMATRNPGSAHQGEVGSFSHYLPGFIYATGGWPWDFWSINSMTWLVTLKVELDLGLSLGAAGDGVCNPVIHN